jgi:diguanylate cyclase (GGDEF)-like protein
MDSEKGNKGISLRTTFLLIVIVAAVISALLFYSTFRLSVGFKHLADSTEEQIEKRKAARELMEASDYMTERVQCFVIRGEIRFIDEYFTEVLKNNRREEAIGVMSIGAGDTAALQSLQTAMAHSMLLMETEYYAMRLVIDAHGLKNYPEVLASVQLTEEDMALSPEEKVARAVSLVFSDDYYDEKENIRQYMQASLDELERMVYETDETELDTFGMEVVLVRIAIIIQIAGVIFLVWFTSRMGIHPVLKAVERIKSDNPIPDAGAREFRYLARAYNRMYEVYKCSLARLNFKASHDELTGAYNRAGYELLLSSLDLRTTYMLLFDVDNFKTINDTYGHEVGDKVLVKFVKILKNNFRSDDCICRIGGDEFVVLMTHIEENMRDLVANKINRINAEMSRADDGLPPASLSVGITHGREATDVGNLFSKSDAAMYRSKKVGKHTFTFSADN